MLSFFYLNNCLYWLGKFKHLFSTMCLLQDSLEQKVDEYVEFIIGCRNSDKITLTKWSWTVIACKYNEIVFCEKS